MLSLCVYVCVCPLRVNSITSVTAGKKKKGIKIISAKTSIFFHFAGYSSLTHASLFDYGEEINEAKQNKTKNKNKTKSYYLFASMPTRIAADSSNPELTSCVELWHMLSLQTDSCAQHFHLPVQAGAEDGSEHLARGMAVCQRPWRSCSR